MKACVLHAVKDLRCEEVKDPVLKKGEVLIRIKAAGICGSDMPRVFEKGTYSFPTIPGHEFAGEIVSVSEELDSGLVGKKATVFPLLPCGKCEFCEIGEYAQCKNYNYFGSRCDGGFAEYIAVPLWNVVPVDDSISFEEAAMCEPASVALHALSQVGISVGDTVAIFGAGTIGAMLASWSRVWGAGKIILVDVDQKKLDFMRGIGFEYLVNSTQEDAVEKIHEMTGGRGADVSVEGSGYSAALENCMKVTRSFGRVVLMGNPAGEMSILQKAYSEILRKQLSIKGTWNSSYNGQKNDWVKTIAAMAAGKLALKPLITHRFRLEDCNKAFNIIKERQELTVKVMLIND